MMGQKSVTMLSLLLATTQIWNVSGFQATFSYHRSQKIAHLETQMILQMAEQSERDATEGENSRDVEDDGDDQPIVETTIRIDDGGSNLTDRFKYKVNALMGVFDPQTGEDSEKDGQGNILNAMLNFPVRYAFVVVGRTGGDKDVQEKYIEDVKKVVLSSSGDIDGMESKITPRGKNFIKIECTVTVESAAMINSIYDDLDELEATTMRF